MFKIKILEPSKQTDILDFNSRIELRCLALSLKPIQELLREAQDEFYQVSASSTRLFGAADGPHGQSHWQQIVNRPVRCLDTIIMKEERSKQ